MKEYPLAIAVAALIYEDKILLIRRLKGDYAGLLGLPGGKIEKHEHVSEAATREVFEESGISAEFKDVLGVVSEHLVENNKVLQHFLLHICELMPTTTKIVNDQEGKLAWFDLKNLPKMKDSIIPSDFFIIERMVLRKDKNYVDCIMEKIGNQYVLKKFE